MTSKQQEINQLLRAMKPGDRMELIITVQDFRGLIIPAGCEYTRAKVHGKERAHTYCFERELMAFDTL